jgi:hypothetical protein
MNDERLEIAGSELTRWLVIAGLVVAGIALFFWLAPRAQPVVGPMVPEAVP